MNIAFHYYTIKALCLCAGYTEPQAQRVAIFSQFVDDYANHGSAVSPEAVIQSLDDELIREAIALNITRKSGTKYITEMRPTGFTNSIWDIIGNLSAEQQNNMLTPYHFVPANQLNEGNYNVPTEPANPDGSEIISVLLREAGRRMKTERVPSERSLMHLGMLLHIFADTYAHQSFVGHRYAKNQHNIMKVYRRNTPDDMEDVTDKYMKWGGVIPFSTFPAIGHSTAGHTPDDTNVLATLELSGGTPYERDNHRIFSDLLAKLLPFLLNCHPCPSEPLDPGLAIHQLGQIMYTDNNDLVNVKAVCEYLFKTDFFYDRAKVHALLMPNWKASEEIENAETANGYLVGDYAGSVTNEFFMYTIIAYNIRKRILSDRYFVK